MDNPTGSPTFSILVVDDNPAMATALFDILVLEGFTPFQASSGAKALQILDEHPIDVMLTDVIMPEMDGVELYRRSRQAHPQLITILMTAYAADELIQRGMSEGIKTVLTKPIDIDFLILLLNTYKKRKAADNP
jgi:CheY-like chemotaxis protein